MHVKVCGVRTAEVAVAAVEAGADLIGVMLEPRSPRHASPAEVDAVVAAVRGRADVVAVMVSPTAERVAEVAARHAVAAVQAHGDVRRSLASASPVPVIRAVNPTSAAEAYTVDWWPDCLLLLDAPPRDLPGGTGTRVDLTVATEVARRRRILLAGGLGPDTVAEAISVARPDGVDASSGLESAPGVKDTALVVAYVRAARAAAVEAGI
ncbi:MAG TPA: phosphoribosylanthranilate isomerase [Candidatus Dormibacteraeota bacterium]|nr:phosphoribosylanthranilate isomerase [Candidatus Dormibacteraeota bacterium]